MINDEREEAGMGKIICFLANINRLIRAKKRVIHGLLNFTRKIERIKNIYQYAITTIKGKNLRVSKFLQS